MTTAEKILRAKADIDAVFEAGKAQGGGGDNYYDVFWDTYQSRGARRHYNNGFAGEGWKDNAYNPKYDFGKITYANSMYAGSYIVDTLKPVNVSEAKSTITSMFASAPNLKKIRTITIAEKNVLNISFNNLTALEEIEFDGVIGCSLDFHWSTKLTADSLESIVTHLSSTATGKTITFPTTAESTYNAKHGDGAWAALLATKQNWSIAYA